MLKHHLKTAFRNLLKEKTYSFINIIGMSVALASCFIILLYSVHELSYDRYDKKLDRTYLLTMNFIFKSEGWTQPLVPFPTGPALKAEYPEVEEYARWRSNECSIDYGGKTFRFLIGVSADSSIFRILTLPIVSGNLEGAFADHNYIVISRELAKRIFGNKDAVGRVLNVNWAGEKLFLTVGAVMANIPSTSTFKADCILPIFPAEQWIKKITPNNPNILNAWMPGSFDTYLLLSNENSAQQLSKELAGFSRKHSTMPTWPLVLHILPLKEFYFRPETIVNTYLMPKGNLSDVEIYSAIALLTLLIACLNFVMLSSARASTKTKEIGVRKVVGASRADIAKQTMTESLMVALISLPLALILVELFTPSLTTLLGRRLPVDYDRSLEAFVLYILVTLVAAVLSGSYVSFYLSGLRPSEILRNKFSRGRERADLRRILIGIQMIISAALILASVTIYRQMSYFHDHNMGFDNKNLVVFTNYTSSLVDPSKGKTYRIIRSEVEAIPNVVSAAGGTWVPPTPGMAGGVTGQAPSETDPQKKVLFTENWVRRGYFKTLGMKMVEGNSFQQLPQGEAKDAVIMNQEAMKEFDVTDPSDQLFQGHRIVGVVKNFNFLSLHQRIGPVVFHEGNGNGLYDMVVRLKSLRDAQKTAAAVRRLITKFDGGKEVHYQFFNDRINALYGSDYKFAEMIGFFTGLAIFIACLGLFGMSLFVLQRRVKEIGVRKVLGASVMSILLSSAREFVVILLVSTAVSLPISIYIINMWLQEYAYHIDVNFLSVLLTLLAGTVIVFLTVIYQALKAARANPVEALRYE